jgi:hypothetical protein
MNLNELHWLRFRKIRLQEFCLSYLIIKVEGPPNYFFPGPGKPWDGPACLHAVNARYTVKRTT